MQRGAAILLALTLGLILSGGSLGFLQVVAWTGMVVSRAQAAPVSEAIRSTIDGQHPCAICRFLRCHRQLAPEVLPTKLELAKYAIVDVDPMACLVNTTGVITTRRQPRWAQTADGVAVPPPVPPPRV